MYLDSMHGNLHDALSRMNPLCGLHVVKAMYAWNGTEPRGPVAVCHPSSTSRTRGLPVRDAYSLDPRRALGRMDFFSSAIQKAQASVDQALGIDEALANDAMGSFLPFCE